MPGSTFEYSRKNKKCVKHILQYDIVLEFKGCLVLKTNAGIYAVSSTTFPPETAISSETANLPELIDPIVLTEGVWNCSYYPNMALTCIHGKKDSLDTVKIDRNTKIHHKESLIEFPESYTFWELSLQYRGLLGSKPVYTIVSKESGPRNGLSFEQFLYILKDPKSESKSKRWKGVNPQEKLTI